MDIKFYVPKDEIIPTQLRLEVDGKIVVYNRVSDKFAYDFEVYHATREEAEEIVNQIVRKMCYQSYDHGAEWRVINKEILYHSYASYTIRVHFRIKDCY